MRLLVFISILFFYSDYSFGQYTDYIGAGHDAGITVTVGSSELNASPQNTINGSGMNAKYFEAARFLSQTTMGHTPAMVDSLIDSGLDFDGWLEDQFSRSPTYLTDLMWNMWDTIYAWLDIYNDPEDIFGPNRNVFNYAYWQVQATNNNDLLRHKMANALTQIFVVSDNSNLGSWAEALTGYYDMMLDDAFGNFRDILYDVTMSIQMGYYLSHFNNSRHFPDENTYPDENYAREIMQLFSIGLYELNIDGTRKIDSLGNFIPTYDNNDIQEFAKIFTGLGMSELKDTTQWPYTPQFGIGIWVAKKDKPMKMYENFHDPGPKYLLNDLVVPAGQLGLADINMAIDNLFNHPNVGPFIGRKLIQRLVKSNPSPQYIARVASTFNDNGAGVRGDMKAVIKAIFLDPEARNAEYINNSSGRAKEPLQKYTAFLRAIPMIAPKGRYWEVGTDFSDATGQSILKSRTVFNFFPPDFSPIGVFDSLGLFAPELKIHNTSTGINWVNKAFQWRNKTITNWIGTKDTIANQWIKMDTTIVMVDYSVFDGLVENPELLVNELDKRLTLGQLTDQTRHIIVDGLRQIYWTWNNNWKNYRLRSALYFMLISPEYNALE